MVLDTVVCKGIRFNENVILDVKTTETFQHTFFPLSPTDLPKEFEESVSNSKERLMVDDGQRLPTQFERKIAIRNKWSSRKPTSTLLKQNSKEEKEMLIAFRDTISAHGALGVYCERKSWILIQNQPLICQIFKEPPTTSYKKGKSWQRATPRADVSLLHGF